MTRLLILPLIVLSVLFLNINSQANVLVNDADSNAVSDENFEFTSEVVPTGSGQEGDYILIGCGVSPTIPNTTFFPPSPGTWTELDQGECFNNVCAHGIWGRFTDNTSSENITCSWNAASFVFAAGSFRYNDVDMDNPIIAVECASGVSEGPNSIATAPSVITEAGSQVARIYTYTNDAFAPTNHSSINNETSATFISNASSGDDVANVNMEGQTEFFENGGPTGEASTIVAQEVAFWRACTIALRMAPVVRNVPTLSEWGFIAVAAFMGIAGIWFLRRKQAEEA